MKCNWEVRFDAESDEWTPCTVEHEVENGDGEDHRFGDHAYNDGIVKSISESTDRVRRIGAPAS